MGWLRRRERRVANIREGLRAQPDLKAARRSPRRYGTWTIASNRRPASRAAGTFSQCARSPSERAPQPAHRPTWTSCSLRAFSHQTELWWSKNLKTSWNSKLLIGRLLPNTQNRIIVSHTTWRVAEQATRGREQRERRAYTGMEGAGNASEWHYASQAGQSLEMLLGPGPEQIQIQSIWYTIFL